MRDCSKAIPRPASVSGAATAWPKSAERRIGCATTAKRRSSASWACCATCEPSRGSCASAPRRCAALRPRRADPRRLPGLQHEDGALRQGARHPHFLLHRPESVGVARMAREGDPPVRRPTLHHLPLRTRLLSPATASRPYSRGIRCSTPSRLGRRRSPRARSSAVRTDWTNGPWWRSWRAAAAAKSKPTCR